MSESNSLNATMFVESSQSGIEKLVEMGFDRDVSRTMLSEVGGDVDVVLQRLGIS